VFVRPSQSLVWIDRSPCSTDLVLDFIRERFSHVTEIVKKLRGRGRISERPLGQQDVKKCSFAFA
jgi:hypothetical protein